MTESLCEAAPREMKMPCGCYGDYRQGNTQATWVVTAEAFLCSQKHKQGQVVVVVDHDVTQRARYRRRPDVVEAMQWNPSEPSMQDVLTWLREEGQVFKTVGRQVWVEWGDAAHKSWMVVHSGDYVVRKTEGRRYFYVEAAKNFEEARELDA